MLTHRKSFVRVMMGFLKKSQEIIRIKHQGGISHGIGNGVRYMNIETRPISGISRRATHILFKEMSVVDTIRFLNHFSLGLGDYTKELENWLGEITLNDAISQIKDRKNCDKIG